MRRRALLVIALVILTAVGIVVKTVAAAPDPGFVPIDYNIFGRAGGQVLTLHWGSVFISSIIQAGPFELAYWGIPFTLGVTSHLAWIVTGIIANSLAAIVLAVVAERLLRTVIATWSVVLAVGLSCVAAASGVLTAVFTSGHPAELVIPLLWVIAAALARRGHPAAAAAVLASTVGWELWGILGIPVLLLAPRIDSRVIWRSAVAGIVVIATIFGPFLLVGPFPMFQYSWSVHDGSLAHLLFPHRLTFPWPLRAAQGVVSLTAGTATALLLRRRADAIWLVPLAFALVRIVLDPVLAEYYVAPAVLLLFIGIGFAIAQRKPLILLVCLVAETVLLVAQLSVTTGAITILLTVVLIVLLRSGRGDTSGRQVVPKRARSRI